MGRRNFLLPYIFGYLIIEFPASQETKKKIWTSQEKKNYIHRLIILELLGGSGGHVCFVYFVLHDKLFHVQLKQSKIIELGVTNFDYDGRVRYVDFV